MDSIYFSRQNYLASDNIAIAVVASANSINNNAQGEYAIYSWGWEIPNGSDRLCLS